jgi:hypothetical protein
MNEIQGIVITKMVKQENPEVEDQGIIRFPD